MIKAEKDNVSMKGSIDELMAEFTLIIRSMYEALTEMTDEEYAKEGIALCGKLAFDVERTEREKVIVK